MDETALHDLLDRLLTGEASADEVVERLRTLPFTEIDGAVVDHHRTLRQGRPEAVYGPGKSPEHCARIVAELLDHGDGPVIVTRVSVDQVKAVEALVGPGRTEGGCLLYRETRPARAETVVVVTAGTADLPVADECAVTLQAYGFEPRRIADVGVAGLHRLLAHVGEISAADAVVVVAGMEGALASVVGGLTAAPVIAVPTSVGYGSSLDGVTALLAMTASCASGIAVVGIDNGFGAAFAVARALGRR